MKLFLICIVSFMMLGCTTFSSYPGYYSVEAYDANGNKIETANLIGDGSSINRLINGACIAFPGSKLIIKSVKTKKELSELSPYQCKGKRNAVLDGDFIAPQEMTFDNQYYQQAFKSKNSQQSIYEYTTNKEKIKNWKKLITLKYENEIVSPNELINNTKLSLKSNVKKLFIESEHVYMVLIFQPDKQHPYFETSIKKSFHDMACGGTVVLSYAKKYSTNTSINIINNENDHLLTKMKKDSWKPACNK